MRKIIFSVIISIFAIVLLTSAGTAVPYVGSNLQSGNLETHQREYFRDKIKSFFSRIGDKNSMVSANPGNLTLLQLLRIIIAFILIIPSWILMALGAIPMLLYAIVIMVVFNIMGFIFTLSLIPALLFVLIPMIYLICYQVISSNGEIGFIEALRKIFNPDNLHPQNFPIFDLRGIDGEGC